jgi:DNA helicase II / ATP-dependent DNA helicase PcrA
VSLARFRSETHAVIHIKTATFSSSYMADNILDGLNPEQKCAVTSQSSVLQVLAPPGSGKTKTLTTRVAYLIAHEKLRPWNMIVCTFTIKAAREMKERIRNFVGNKLESKLVLGTFHSIARRYLVTYGQHIGIAKNFGIADSSDSLAIIKRIIKRNDYQTEPARARARISRTKSGVNNPPLATAKHDPEQQEFDRIYTEYEETLRFSNLLDYDDLLLRCVELLKRCPECVSNIEAVLIDEFQDTNSVQYQLMKLFAQHRGRKDAGRSPSITIVGDPDQSIYSFRSAEIKNLRTMTREYPDTHVVNLEENYRSSGSILQSALELIEQDTARPAKKLLATHCIGVRPVLRTLPTAAAEASWLVAELQRILTSSARLLKYVDCAVLLRSAHLSRHIETALGKAGIPYRMIGGHKFFDRTEIKILLDYLRVIGQPDHNDALVRIINVPSRKIGDATTKALLEEAETQKRTFWSLILDIAQGRMKPESKLSAQAEKGLASVVNIILTSHKKLANDSNPPCTIFDLLGHVMKKLSYEEYIRKSHPEDFENRWDNVQQLILLASDASYSEQPEVDDSLFEIGGVDQRTLSGPAEALQRFLANVALSAETETAKEGEEFPNLVTISTIHAAKGLEWPVVFIPAAYQGSIPHSRAEDTDEERRLLYVGMTRAQSLLYLSWPKKSSSGDATTLSPFLSQKKMSPYFDKRGPSFAFTVVQDLARILRRADNCPSEAAMNESKATLEHAEDDVWPEDGEEPQPETTYFSSSFSQPSSDWDPFPSRPAKRPRLQQTNSDPSVTATAPFKPPSFRGSDMPRLNSEFISASRLAVLQQGEDSNAQEIRIPSFTRPSIHRTGSLKPRTNINSGIGTIGFMSATAKLKEDEMIAVNLQAKQKPVPSIPLPSTITGKENIRTVVSKGKRKHISGQGSLLKFFGKKET